MACHQRDVLRSFVARALSHRVEKLFETYLLRLFITAQLSKHNKSCSCCCTRHSLHASAYYREYDDGLIFWYQQY